MLSSFSHPAKGIVGVVFFLSWIVALFALFRLKLEPILCFLFPFGVLLISCLVAWLASRRS
ncbi:MAG: hypothetical protein AB7K52_08350 [Phycisphaerales bacterium]